MTSGGVSKRAVSMAVIDDQDVVHAGIRAWCADADPPIHLAGSFSSPEEFLTRHPDAPNEFEVVLLDLQIGGNRPDFDTLRRLCNAGQWVIVYSDLDADEVVLTSLDLGVATYLVKSEGKRHLIEALHAAGSATPYVGPRMAKALLNDNTLGRIKLSQREKEVLVAWFRTESKEDVGKRLHIAPTTVCTHLRRVRAKYASVGRPAPTKSALLARAVEDGLLSLNDVY